MAIHLAEKTLAAIEAQVRSDQGSLYRQKLGEVLPHIGDAYDPKTFPFRSHMGASGLGDKCPRKIWYGFRWVTKQEHKGQLLRLFNRGHLEEGRFIAMLLAIGVQVYQQDAEGKQFRIYLAGGHSGGSGDGVGLNIPDLDPNTPALLEFKTANDKSFRKLKEQGVKENKWVHYVQTNLYMYKMGLACTLYMCVNKNNDELYGEIIHLDERVALQYIDRGESLVFTDRAPKRISNSPAWFECKFCDHHKVCHKGEKPFPSCRSCRFSLVNNDGTWECAHPSHPQENLTKEQQYQGCQDWENLLDNET